MAELTDELNATVSALLEATQTLVDISSRNFSTEMSDLNRYQALTEAAVSLATRLWDSINAISNRVSKSCTCILTAST